MASDRAGPKSAPGARCTESRVKKMECSIQSYVNDIFLLNEKLEQKNKNLQNSSHSKTLWLPVSGNARRIRQISGLQTSENDYISSPYMYMIFLTYMYYKEEVISKAQNKTWLLNPNLQVSCHIVSFIYIQPTSSEFVLWQMHY